MDELDIIKVFFILHHNTPVVPHFATPKLSEKVLREGAVLRKGVPVVPYHRCTIICVELYRLLLNIFLQVLVIASGFLAGLLSFCTVGLWYFRFIFFIYYKLYNTYMVKPWFHAVEQRLFSKILAVNQIWYKIKYEETAKMHLTIVLLLINFEPKAVKSRLLTWK